MVHEDQAPYYEVTSVVCWKCRATGNAVQDAAESNNGRAPAGRFYWASPRD